MLNWIGNGLSWLTQRGIDGLLYIGGHFCRFMVNECTGTFIVFALIGGIIYIGGGDKLGMKFIRISFVTYISMAFVGWCF